MELVFGRPGRSLDGYSDYLENTRSYFLPLVFRCHTQFERHGLLGECMGWTKRAILGFAIIAPLKYIIGYDPWVGGEQQTNSLTSQVDSRSDGN